VPVMNSVIRLPAHQACGHPVHNDGPDENPTG
jgi:hypothetical protein